MNMRHIFNFFLLCVVFPAMPSYAEIFLHETFESADMSLTNSDGFFWERNNRTSVIYGDDTTSIVVWNNGPINNVRDDMSWNAYEGLHALRFRWNAGVEWSEQRFNLGKPKPELWLSYFVQVPENYEHCYTCSRQNNKFLSIWMDGYEANGDGSTFWLSMEGAGGGNTDLAFTYSRGGNTGSVGMQQHFSFIDSSRDRGRWMQVVIHLKVESSDGASDGLIETWRRWADEPEFSQMHSKTDVPLRMPDSGPLGFQQGYFFGWANGTYSENTDWLMDEIKFSTTSLLEGKVSELTIAPPVAPAQLMITVDK